MNGEHIYSFLEATAFATIFVAIAIVVGGFALAAYFFWRGRAYAGVIALLVASAFPLYSAYDWMRGASLSRQFSDVTIVEPVDRSLPVVLAIVSPDLCGRVCVRLLSTGAMNELLQTGTDELTSRGKRKGEAYRIWLIADCKIPPENFHYARRCTRVTQIASLPAMHTRISLSTGPLPQVYEKGFPRLGDVFEGSYFLLVQRIDAANKPADLAYAFRHVRLPSLGIPFLEMFVNARHAVQAVGARMTQEEALDRIMGWRLAQAK